MNKNQLENIFTLCRELPTLTASTYIQLCRIANRHRNMCERACNYGFKTDAEEQAHEAKLARCAAKFGRLLHAEVDREVEFYEQRDPRGSTLRLLLPSGRYNTMGGAESGWSL